ncbi:MAG: ThuA domain-containing protein [Woeseiaceae bacterium]|nr:ThuA domain-containing protein [Woeseiaceae bacterium]
MKSFIAISLCLLFVASGAAAQEFNVAVVEAADGGEGGGQATVDQLNDDSFFDFSATLVDPTQVDSADEVANYDVIIIGGSGFGSDPLWTVDMANALKSFVEAGGGLLVAGWGHWNAYTSGMANREAAAILDTVVPGDFDNSYSFTFDTTSSGTNIELTDLGHPITEGLPDIVTYGLGCCLEYNSHPLQAGDVSLGIPSTPSAGPGHAVIYRENIGAGTGRTVYLGAVHLGSVMVNPSMQPMLRGGLGDQLLEQAVAWAGSNVAVEADSDGDGLIDYDDYCPDTTLPESVPTVRLNPNHWALMDDDGEFDTLVRGKGKGPNRSYSIEDTHGCSCEQIIEAQGLGNGLSMYGCSIDVMDDWVGLVNP